MNNDWNALGEEIITCNSVTGLKKNVAHHLGLIGDLYKLHSSLDKLLSTTSSSSSCFTGNSYYQINTYFRKLRTGMRIDDPGSRTLSVTSKIGSLFGISIDVAIASFISLYYSCKQNKVMGSIMK